jgi:hypothetical protein
MGCVRALAVVVVVRVVWVVWLLVWVVVQPHD